MAYVSDHRKGFGMGFPKKEILIDYVSRSCDLPKKKKIDCLRKHFLKNYQKRKFDRLHKHFWRVFSKKYQKRKFDGLCKQVT